MCEPNLKQYPEFDLQRLDTVLRDADIVLVLVDDHRLFRKLTAAQLQEKIVIDTRGVV